MMSFITHFVPMLIKNILHILIISLLLVGCTSPNTSFSDRKVVTLLIENKYKIETILSISDQQHSLGLSGTKLSQFSKEQAMLFYYSKDGMRKFWMPNTLFNLDIFFLDSNLKVIAVERNVPHHPGIEEPPMIYRTKAYYCRHVLEMRSDSPLAKKLEVGSVISAEKDFFL